MAAVQTTPDGPRWLVQPAKVHIEAGLMLDAAASAFIAAAYSVSQGCEAGVLHGDLTTAPPAPTRGAGGLGVGGSGAGGWARGMLACVLKKA